MGRKKEKIMIALDYGEENGKEEGKDYDCTWLPGRK